MRIVDFLSDLVRFETTLWNRVEHALLDCGHVGLGTLLALRIVGDAGGNARVLDVSEALAITIGAASKQIDRLERSGLAERRPHPHDRRSSLLSLTAAGARARQAGDAAVAALIDELLPNGAEAALARGHIQSLQRSLDAARPGT